MAMLPENANRGGLASEDSSAEQLNLRGFERAWKSGLESLPPESPRKSSLAYQIKLGNIRAAGPHGARSRDYGVSLAINLPSRFQIQITPSEFDAQMTSASREMAMASVPSPACPTVRSVPEEELCSPLCCLKSM